MLGFAEENLNRRRVYHYDFARAVACAKHFFMRNELSAGTFLNDKCLHMFVLGGNCIHICVVRKLYSEKILNDKCIHKFLP